MDYCDTRVKGFVCPYFRGNVRGGHDKGIGTSRLSIGGGKLPRVAMLVLTDVVSSFPFSGLFLKALSRRRFSCTAKKNLRKRGRRRGLDAGQYSLGRWITLLAKYRVSSSSGKSVCSISLVNTILPLPSPHESVAVRSGCTASFQT